MAQEEISKEQEELAKVSQETDQKANTQQETAAADQAIADAQAASDKLNQKQASMFQEIGKVVKDFRKKLDGILGNMQTPSLDPSDPKFDINASIGDFDAILKPLMAVAAPIGAIAGQLPIIGDLMGMMGNITTQASAADTVDKEKLEKLLPKKPELPQEVKDDANGIIMDIMIICIQIPMMLINFILQTINTIYSKLNIITSVIPLGNLFPLPLVGTAITGVPTFNSFISTAPQKIKSIIEGAARNCYAAATTMAVPQPPTTPPYPEKLEVIKKKEDAAYATSQNQQQNESEGSAEQSDPKQGQQIESPIESNVKPIEATPPIAPKSFKDISEVHSYWKSEFGKLGNKFKAYAYNEAFDEDEASKTGQMHKYFKREGEAREPDVAIDWLKQCIEMDGKLNKDKCNEIWKSTYSKLTNRSGTGFKRVEFTHYQAYEAHGVDKVVLAKPPKGPKYQRRKITFCCQEYDDKHALKADSDIIQKYISDLKQNSKYTAQQKNIDKSIELFNDGLDVSYKLYDDEVNQLLTYDKMQEIGYFNNK